MDYVPGGIFNAFIVTVQQVGQQPHSNITDRDDEHGWIRQTHAAPGKVFLVGPPVGLINNQS